MPNRVDLTGKHFGNLVAMQPAGRVRGRDGAVLWLCRCTCGARVVKRADNLLSGVTKSCGYAHRWAWRDQRNGEAEA